MKEYSSKEWITQKQTKNKVPLLLSIPATTDVHTYLFDQNMSDGLPMVPPTLERFKWMLTGTDLPPSTVLGKMPPILATCTVANVAVTQACNRDLWIVLFQCSKKGLHVRNRLGPSARQKKNIFVPSTRSWFWHWRVRTASKQTQRDGNEIGTIVGGVNDEIYTGSITGSQGVGKKSMGHMPWPWQKEGKV